MAGIIIATASYDRSIRLWDAASTRCTRMMAPPKEAKNESHINKMELTPDGKYLAAAGNPNIKFFDARGMNNSAVLSFTGHAGNVTSIGFQRQSKWMFTSSEDQTVKLWDLSASGCARDFKHSSSVTCATLHPNQAEIIVGLQDGTIRVIDLTAGKVSCVLSMSDDESAIRSVAASSDGKWLVGTNNEGTCTVYEMPQRDSSIMDKKKSWKAHNTYILKAAFSPNGKMLATTSADETVKLWNVTDWNEEKTLTGHTQWVWDCAFSADSAYLLTGSSDKTARLWDLAQGETVRVYQGHAKSVVCVTLNDVTDIA